MNRKLFAGITFYLLIAAWITGFILDLNGLLAEAPGRFAFPGGIGLIYGLHLLYFREEDSDIGRRTWWIRGFGNADGVSPGTMAFIGAFFIVFGVFHLVRYAV